MLNRRAFLKASAIALVTTALSNTKSQVSTLYAQNGSGDVEVLNYLLTLEYIMARAYQQINRSGLVTGRAQDLFIDFGAQENAHVVALVDRVSQLGGRPVRAAEAYNFPELSSVRDAFEFLHNLEELTAAAYLGQLPTIQERELRTTIASIHNVEGQHAVALADLLNLEPGLAFAVGQGMNETLNAIDPFFTATTPTEMPRTGFGGLRHAVQSVNGPRLVE